VAVLDLKRFAKKSGKVQKAQNAAARGTKNLPFAFCGSVPLLLGKADLKSEMAGTPPPIEIAIRDSNLSDAVIADGADGSFVLAVAYRQEALFRRAASSRIESVWPLWRFQ